MAEKADSLDLLKVILLWEGRVKNARVQELFGLGSVRSSELIREFRNKYPDWLVWDNKTKSYHAKSKVYQALKKGPQDSQVMTESLSQYLALIGLPYFTANDGRDSQSHRTIWAAFPNISIPSPKTYSLLSESIRANNKVKMSYRSMRTPLPHERVISPHSLVRVGRRWHVRAFCDTTKEFRDYVLGRISDIKITNIPAEQQEANDVAWNTRVPVRLIAHPDLTPDQESLIRFEYFNNTAARVDTCRGALVGYYIQDIRAAVNIKKQRPPEYQLAVSNYDEVQPWLFPTG